MFLQSPPTLCKCILTSNVSGLLIQVTRFTLERWGCVIQSPALGGWKDMLSHRVLLSLMIPNPFKVPDGVCPHIAN